MKNKLPFVVTTNHLFFPRDINEGYLKPHKRKFLYGNLFFTLILTLFLLFSGKSYAQLSESFESGIPAEWTLFGNGVGTSNWSATTDGYSGSDGVSINPSADNIGDQNTAQYFLVSPQVTVPENGEIQFYTKQASDIDNGAEYQIRISTAAQPDINGFNIIIKSYTEADLNIGLQTSYEKKVVKLPESIPAGLNIYIAFVAVNTQNGATPTGDEWFVDEVAVLEGCIEIVDTDFEIDNIGIDTADLSWSHPGTTSFEIQVIPEGGTPANSGIPVTGTSYALTNLEAETSYDAYISAFCSNDTQSNWSGPYTFETLKYGLSCDYPIELPDVLSSPYVLVDNLANYSNPDVTYNSTGSNCLSDGENTNYLEGDKIFLRYTATEDALINITQTAAGWDPNNPIGDCWNSNTSVLIYQDCSDVGLACLAGLKTDYSNEQAQIQNFLVETGQTYIIVISSDLSPDAGVCFEFEIKGSTCAAPSDINYDDLTDTSVTFSWSNVGGFADSWEYMAVPTGSGEPTTAGTPTVTNATNSITTGLDAGATYDFYVRSVCNGTPGEWSSPYTITMQCSALDTPYSTNFDNAGPDNPELCWAVLDVNNDGSTWFYDFGYTTLQTYSAQANNNDLLISPKINFDGVTQKRIRFKYISLYGSTFFSVKLSTTGIGADNFTTIVLPETEISDSGWDNWQEMIVEIPVDIVGEVNVAWVIEPNANETASNFSIDDVFIEDKPACPNPLSPNVDNVGVTTADFSWTQGDEETQWQIVIQDLNAGLPNDEGILVSDNPYTATDLESAHRYEYYVRAYCNDVEQSEWIGPVTFITDCVSFDTPFFESFNDSDTNTQKFCWSTRNENQDMAQWVISENESVLQPSNSWFNPTVNFDDWLISPPINVDSGNKELKFKYRAQFSPFTGPPRFGVEVLISTTDTDPSSFSVLSPLQVFTNSSYTEKTLYFQEEGTIYIAFRVPPEYDHSLGSSILNIDDVSIVDAPDCPEPSDIEVSSIMNDSALINWVAGYGEANWNVVVQPQGIGLPPQQSVQVSTLEHAATGLEPGTVYEVYLQAACDSGNSEWAGPVTFTTICNPYTTPFLETFNTDSESEYCWTIVNNNNDLDTWQTNSGIYPYEGDHSAGMFTGNNGANDDWLISPLITVQDNQRLRYYYRVHDNFFAEDLKILLSTNGVELSEFTTVLYNSADDTVLINNEAYKEKVINLPDGIIGDVNIAFHIPQVASSGPYRGQMLMIDNFIVEDIPECPEPSNVSISNITDVAFDVTWDANGDETAWEVSVQPFGTDAPVGDTNPDYLYTAASNPFTVTGLTAALKYDVYVRAVCDGFSEGTWTEAVEVITKCSFDNLCQYTILLTGDSNSSSIAGGIDVIQNDIVVQTLEFPTGQFGAILDPEEYTILFCAGGQFSLFWDSLGTVPNQYPEAQVEVQDVDGNTVWISELGIGTPRTTLYSGVANCGVQSCPQPTDLTANDFSELSWTAGDSETEWEVAIQPLANGTLPQSGTLVSTNSYTPTAADFSDEYAATYEYFVRAICGTDDESYWSGPYKFVRNNDASTALQLPINEGENCDSSAVNVSFINASTSPDAMSCEGVSKSDVWFEFTAISRVHIIEANGFTGNFFIDSGDEPYPDFTMTLYRSLPGGVLEELNCDNNNSLVAAYSSELIIGENYKVRLTLNSPDISTRLFNVCVTTPLDLCQFDAVNYDFERPALVGPSGLTSIGTQYVVPGWRQNMETHSGDAIFIWEPVNAMGFVPYSGGQCIQLIADDPSYYEEDATIIRGLYKEFDSSEITLFDYSFAHQARGGESFIQLFAGPPEGPYTLITEQLGVVGAWTLHEGSYEVPEGQTITRFVFRSKNYAIGNLLDAANFIPNNKINIASLDQEVDCNTASIDLRAEGVGTWEASASNPSEVIISDAAANDVNISGFTTPGTYTFTWKSRYCEDTIELTYNGIAEMPTVETPVEYCLNETADALTADATGTYSLVWYTEAVGGTGSAIAPTPDTSVVGDTSYFVANADVEGCEGPRAEIVVTVNPIITPELSFSYDDTCAIAMDNPLPTLATDFTLGGTFSSTTLIVDALTGEVDMTSATAGSHDVVYTFNEDAETCTLAGTFTATIEFTGAVVPETNFDYGTDTFCLLNGDTVLPTLATGFTSGGTFSSTTVTVDATTGEIDLTSGTAGMHDVVYTLDVDAANCMEAGTFTTSIEIVETNVPVTDFTYSDVSFCTDSANALVEQVANFTTGGTFSAETGLSIDATTGEINFSTSSAGNYNVTYSISEDLSSCTEASTSSYSITVIDAITPVTLFDYGTSSFCLLAGDSASANLDTGFTTGGVFSSTSLTVNASTGEVDLTSASAGIHEVVYTYEGDASICMNSGTYTATIDVVQVNSSITGFTYEYDLYCADNSNVLPILDSGFTTGGTFTADNGLSINASTGEINIAASSIGNYTVTYQVVESLSNCTEGSVSTYNVTVLDAIETIIEGACNGSEYWLTASPQDNSYSPDEVTYTWTDANGNTIGQNSETLNVTAYSDQYPNAVLPVQFFVTVEFGGCSTTASFTTERLDCREIPRGISPDGNGKNDDFDLRGYGVTDLLIFNRHGREVYKFSGSYTNQWHGQSNKGDELPDGTYFYSIIKNDGSKSTGWVFINRAH